LRDFFDCQPLAGFTCPANSGRAIAFDQTAHGTNVMLRITSLDESHRITLKLEGSLAGVWVAELEGAWRGMYSRSDGRPLYLDMNGVEHVDRAGTYLLALVRQRGAQLVTSGTLMTELVRSIAADWPSIERK
jgi:anti-anti-sigma regulatory factor